MDSYYYRKLVATTLNVVLYNVLTCHRPDLSGEFKIRCERRWFPPCCRDSYTPGFDGDLISDALLSKGTLQALRGCCSTFCHVMSLPNWKLSSAISRPGLCAELSGFCSLWSSVNRHEMLNSTVSQQGVVNSKLVCGCNTNAVGTSGVSVFASFNPVLGYCCSSQSGQSLS